MVNIYNSGGQHFHQTIDHLSPQCSFQKTCPPIDDDFYTTGPGIYYSPYRNSDVRWNFEKFLINREGKPVYRYPTRINPTLFRADIERLLNENMIQRGFFLKK